MRTDEIASSIPVIQAEAIDTGDSGVKVLPRLPRDPIHPRLSSQLHGVYDPPSNSATIHGRMEKEVDSHGAIWKPRW